MQFDSLDRRIRHYELLLERELDGLPGDSLPEGYRFVFYRPGDRDTWISIESSAKEFDSYEQGLEAWNRYYNGYEDILPQRMVFIENAAGEKVATATAFFDMTGRDASGSGWVHWVSVRRDEQGRGLSKPLVAHVLKLLRGLGYTHAKVPTQTVTWLAVKVYLDLGFRPLAKNAVNSEMGWRIIRALTGHEALSAFPPASMEELLGESPVE